MLASLGDKKLSVGYKKCKLYRWTTHKGCFKCGEVGHFKAKCPNKKACFKCGGDHSTKDCTSKELKCINCSKNKKEHVNHATYSSQCPYNQ